MMLLTLLLLFFGMVFVADQVTKTIFFSYDSVCNAHTGLSLIAIEPFGFLFWISILMMGIAIVYSIRCILENQMLKAYAWGMLAVGGISNGVDRMFFGCVRDVIPFFGFFQWNIADGFIVLGVILLGISYGILKQ